MLQGSSDFVELITLDLSLNLDIRYARSDNFLGHPATEALITVHQNLSSQGLGLVIFDGYRP